MLSLLSNLGSFVRISNNVIHTGYVIVREALNVEVYVFMSQKIKYCSCKYCDDEEEIK